MTSASGKNAHTEGDFTFANGYASHAEGKETKASSNYQHVSGKYNIEDTSGTYAEIIGNGTANNARSNARTLDWSGNEVLAGSLTINGNQTVATTSDLASKQDTLVSGTNIKTINNTSILGSGNIDVSGGGGTPTDVRINGTSITSNNEADIKTEGTYNASTNKIQQ